MEKRRVTYRVFFIKNEELTCDASDLKDVLQSKLESTTADCRVIPVRDGKDCKEKDFLSSFAPAQGINPLPDYVYGVIMRIRPAKGLKVLPEDFLKLSELKETDLEEFPELSGKIVCSQIYHFLIKGKYLITDLPQIMTISTFQRYINKLLVNRTYGFSPLLFDKSIQLSELKSISFSDSFQQQTNSEDYCKFSLQDITKKVVKHICPSVKGLKTIMEENMVSAKMTVNFSRPKGMSVEKYAKKLSAILAPVQDLENVHFIFADGRKMTGSEMVFSQKEELSEENGITDFTYITSMKRVIDSIEKK